MITVKKEQYVKMALDSKSFKNFHPQKLSDAQHQGITGQHRTNRKTKEKEQSLFSTLSIYNIRNSLWMWKQEINATSFYYEVTQFQLRSYGLMDMPAEFEKAIDLSLTNCESTFACLDGILNLTKGPKVTHKELLFQVMKKLNDENLAKPLDQCKFACEQEE